MDGYDPESVAAENVLEEQALLEEMGVDFYASGSQESTTSEVPALADVQRTAPDPPARVRRTVYEGILRTAEQSLMGSIDSQTRSSRRRRLTRCVST